MRSWTQTSSLLCGNASGPEPEIQHISVGASGIVAIRLIRSAQRTRTVSLREKDGHLEVRAPATLSDVTLQPILERLLLRYTQSQTRTKLQDKDLLSRAQELNHIYFEGTLRWKSITWVTNQGKRWGSCTPATGTIRLSHRLSTVPQWVCDYVIVHELAHLIEAHHNARFWSLVARYPLTERARGYLMALGAGYEDPDKDALES